MAMLSYSKPFSLCIFLWLMSGAVFAQENAVLSGRIRDRSGKPVAFTSVYVKNTSNGTTANENGEYRLRLKPGRYTLLFRFVGYKQVSEEVEIAAQGLLLDVTLEPEMYTLNEIRVGNGEDPAYPIIRRAIANRKKHRDEVKAYRVQVYIKGAQNLTRAPKKLLGFNVAEMLDLDSTRTGTVYLSESESELNIQRPGKVREIMKASKVAGQNNAFSFNRSSDLFVNFYENQQDWGALVSRAMISPVADNALSFYRYKWLGSTEENGSVVHRIAVTPKSQDNPVFNGIIYISENGWRIYSLDLHAYKSAGIKVMDTLHVRQQFIPVSRNAWLPASLNLAFSGNLLGFSFNGYFLSVYRNYELNPRFPKGFFNGEVLKVGADVNQRDTTYWAENRPVPLSDAERIGYFKKDSISAIRKSRRYLDSMDKVNNRFKPTNFLFAGHLIGNTYERRSVRIFPLIQTVQYNTVEGWVFQPKVSFLYGDSTLRLLSITPALRYGFGNRQFNANVDVFYRYDIVHQGTFHFAAGTDNVDLNSYHPVPYFSNTISTLFNKENRVKFYHNRYVRAATERELARGLTGSVELSYSDRRSLNNTSFNTLRKSDRPFTSNNPFTPDQDTELFPHNQALKIGLSATFTPGQTYMTRPEGRFYQPPKYPSLKIDYEKGLPVLGSDVNYDFFGAEIFKDRLNMGLIGNGAFSIQTGAFINKRSIYYPDYRHFMAVQSSSLSSIRNAFRYLPIYLYSTPDHYLALHYEQNLGGSIFSHIPLLKKLNLEEIIGGGYLHNPQVDHYTEFYFGIKRAIFRVEYGMGYRGSKRLDSGFRFAFRLPMGN
ncbi:MAG: carboxypeptidase-like regulatory domain-containing protein [Mucilaginibacter polytrichastri]|nr:carboxypeptidase-like regulatory domain-containing protein [Mucilaginibacter polytrichastri]